MKKENLFIVGLFLIIFIVGQANAVESFDESFISYEHTYIGCLDGDNTYFCGIMHLNGNTSYVNSYDKISIGQISLGNPYYNQATSGTINNINLMLEKGSFTPANEYNSFPLHSMFGRIEDNLSSFDFQSGPILFYSDEFRNTGNGPQIFGTISIEKDYDFPEYFIITVEGLIFNTNEENTYEQRIAALESWQQSIDAWKNTITDTITDILNSIQSLITIADNHEVRIIALESKNLSTSSTTNYFKYLDFKDRGTMACGWGKDNELDLFKMDDLGTSCQIDYSGKNAKCNCEEVEGECETNNENIYCFSWKKSGNYVSIKLKNTANEELIIESVTIEGCEPYDKDYNVKNGNDKMYKIKCEEDFEEGDINIMYRKGSGISVSSVGHIDVN